MKARIFKVYRKDGTVRAIWQDTAGPQLRKSGMLPRRASRVEVITEGPRTGQFYVDMSLLADISSNADLAVCLTSTFDNYADAVAAEVKFIEQNWLLEGVHVQEQQESQGHVCETSSASCGR